MTDKELLELAAKAAGLNAKWFTVKLWTKRKGFGDTRFLCGTKQVFGTHHAKPWNPLTSDGAALRLAVDLRMEIYIHENDIRAVDGELRSAWERHGVDSFAATRRAIVRAAAEIGKAMP